MDACRLPIFSLRYYLRCRSFRSPIPFQIRRIGSVPREPHYRDRTASHRGETFHIVFPPLSVSPVVSRLKGARQSRAERLQLIQVLVYFSTYVLQHPTAARRVAAAAASVPSASSHRSEKFSRIIAHESRSIRAKKFPPVSFVASSSLHAFYYHFDFVRVLMWDPSKFRPAVNRHIRAGRSGYFQKRFSLSLLIRISRDSRADRCRILVPINRSEFGEKGASRVAVYPRSAPRGQQKSPQRGHD